MTPSEMIDRLATLLRSPIANLASVVTGASAQIAPNAGEQPLCQFNGLPGQAQVWNVAIAPAFPQTYPQFVPIRGVNPWTVARFQWTVGNSMHEAFLDLHGGTTIQLAFDTLRVSINYDPPPVFVANDPNPVEWRAQISSAIGSVPAALPTRTLSGGGDATLVVPMWARSVTPLITSASPAYTLNFRDPLGVIIASAYGVVAPAQPPPTIDLPQGTAFVELVGGPNIRWSLIFRLSL